MSKFFLLKKSVAVFAVTVMVIASVVTVYADGLKWKNGDVWIHYKQDGYIHSQMVSEYTHSTSTGYNDALFGIGNGDDVVLNRSGLVIGGNVSYAKSGTHSFYVDRAWYYRYK